MMLKLHGIASTIQKTTWFSHWYLSQFALAPTVPAVCQSRRRTTTTTETNFPRPRARFTPRHPFALPRRTLRPRIRTHRFSERPFPPPITTLAYCRCRKIRLDHGAILPRTMLIMLLLLRRFQNTKSNCSSSGASRISVCFQSAVRRYTGERCQVLVQ